MSETVADVAVPLHEAAAGRGADWFRGFYDDCYTGVAAYVVRLTGDVELARDVTQEAFVRVLARPLRVREPRAFVYRVATNLVRDAWRAGERHRRLLELHDRTPAVVTAPDTALADAVRRLPPRQRDVVMLHYYADLPIADVAAVVRVPPGTVKWLLAEARRALAQALGDDHAD